MVAIRFFMQQGSRGETVQTNKFPTNIAILWFMALPIIDMIVISFHLKISSIIVCKKKIHT